MKVRMNGCQKRFWLDGMVRRDNSDHVAYVYRVRGRFYAAIFRKALEVVVEETEAFHAVYREEKGELWMCTGEGGPLQVEIVREADPERCRKLLKEFGQRLFCLEKEWPLRVCMVQQSDSCYWLEFVFHHICVEASSIGVFLNRLSDVYGTLLVGKKVEEVTVPLLSEYLKEEELYSGQQEKGLAYWQSFFEHAPLGVVFYCDGKGRREEAGCLDFRPDRKLQRRMNELAIGLHTSVFRVWMSAWLWLLAFYSGSRRVVVSYPVNVCPPAFRGVAGPWVNNLACEADVEGDPSFVATLESCGRQRREVRDFQAVLITDIADRLRKTGQLRQGDVFLNAGINYAAWGSMQKLQLGEIQAEFYGRVPMKPQFDLLLEVEPEEGWRCRMVYRNDFPEKQIRRMKRSLFCLLRQVCEDPGLRFSEVSFLPKQEIGHMVRQSNLPDRDPREEFRDFLSCFRETVERGAQLPALLVGENRVSYGELDVISTRIGSGIRQVYRDWKGADLLRGVSVGVCLPRDNSYIAAILGVMKAGGTYVPLDPAYPDERLSFMAADSGMELVVMSRSLEKRIKGVKCVYLEDLPGAETELFPEVKPEDVAYVIYTSGTSGQPKGVPITYLNLFCVIRNFIACFRLKPGIVQLQFSNMGFDASVMELFPVLVAGATICVVWEEERYDPGKLVKRIREKGVSVAYIPPVMLAQIREELPGLKTLMVAGEPTPAEVVARWRKGRRLLNGYGPTENTVLTTFGRLGEKTPANDIGKPWEGVSCYVLDEYRRLVPEGVPGELWIGGWQLTKGYIGRPELNREKFMENPFVRGTARLFNGVLYRTGDVVRRLPNGDLLFMGRCDSQVKIRGFRIELGEIESCLGRLPGVGQVLVVVKEGEGGKRLVAYLQCEQTAPIKEADIRKYLGESLPEYMIPSAFMILDSFPRTVNGKIDRRALPEAEWCENEYVAAETGGERVLTEVVGRILKGRKIGVENDLFTLGLSSLSVVELVTEAEKRGMELSVSTVYRERTIRRIAAVEKSRVCSWYKKVPERKVVVLVCGHMDFGALLRNVAEPLSRECSVLVLESFHDYAEMLPEELTFDGVVAFYVRLLEDIVPEGVFAFAGHCLGGELAYALAVAWAKKYTGLPRVWLFNSLARRKMPLGWMKTGKLHTEAERLLWEAVLKKRKLTDQLVATEELSVYEGEVVLFIPDCFTRHLVSPDLPALADDKTVKYLQEVYEENSVWWKELVPLLQVCRVKGDHWTMLSPEGGEMIVERLRPEINATEI